MKYNKLFICFLVYLIIGCKKNTERGNKNINNKGAKDTLVIEEVNTNEHRVVARNGLSVRIQANIDAEKVNILPYNTKVTVIKKIGNPITINENGFKITGHWVQIKNDSVKKESYVFNGYLKTIEEIKKIYERPMYVSKEKDWGDFYGVYKFSRDVIGIVILEDEEGKQKLDFDKVSSKYNNELFDYENNKHSLYEDTFARLFKNKAVTVKYNALIGKSFYVYCSNEIVETKVQDVLFHVNECSVPFVMLKLDKKVFNSNTGDPIFASKKKIKDIEFGVFPEKTAHFNYITDICGIWSDCKFINDDEHITLFLKYKNFYFGYRNDSDYKDENSIEPYRYVISFNNNIINYHLSSHLDLFGCPCL
ncbi:SH3 domain-containing protein [Tenacibaculum ovolyticum]|uniref:SH3 domain-containing protein n=1 Tax=Tenacibaculum ovolyticum TaxID=104270 RepID=UPI003BABB9DC